MRPEALPHLARPCAHPGLALPQRYLCRWATPPTDIPPPLVSFQVGDSRAAMVHADGSARPLSDDHKPNRPDEKRRVEVGARGGGELWGRGSAGLGAREGGMPTGFELPPHLDFRRSRPVHTPSSRPLVLLTLPNTARTTLSPASTLFPQSLLPLPRASPLTPHPTLTPPCSYPHPPPPSPRLRVGTSSSPGAGACRATSPSPVRSATATSSGSASRPSQK